jgi:tRNA (cytidine32/uridine32-2'-O)-methyltransferase
MNIRIILIGTTHPGNIGAAARAMKSMDLKKLYLVAPKFFPHVEATARAAGADDILAQAKVTATLDEALSGCNLIVGTSARVRALPLRIISPRECAEVIHKKFSSSEIAILFGRESSGLNNEELMRCHYHINIPTNPDFSSLNLASAVQIVAYELYSLINTTIQQKPGDDLAQAEEIAMLYEHLQQTLIDINFLNPNCPRQLMQRLYRLFNRAMLEQKEVNILRGILAQIQQNIK